jgi:outer membrane autotransporter protein
MLVCPTVSLKAQETHWTESKSVAANAPPVQGYLTIEGANNEVQITIEHNASLVASNGITLDGSSRSVSIVFLGDGTINSGYSSPGYGRDFEALGGNSDEKYAWIEVNGVNTLSAFKVLLHSGAEMMIDENSKLSFSITNLSVQNDGPPDFILDGGPEGWGGRLYLRPGAELNLSTAISGLAYSPRLDVFGTIRLLNTQPDNDEYNSMAKDLGVPGIAKITGGGIVNVNSGGLIDLGRNTLVVNDIDFNPGSMLRVARSDTQSGMVEVQGHLDIYEGAILVISDDSSRTINDQNKTIIRVTGPDGVEPQYVHLFDNPLWDLKIEGNEIVVARYKGDDGNVISNGDDSSNGNGGSNSGSGDTSNGNSGSNSGNGGSSYGEGPSIISSPNFADAVTFVDQFFKTGAKVDPELKENLDAYVTIIEKLEQEDLETYEIAVRQLFGEEALTAVNATVATVNQVNGAVGNRFSTIRGYGPAAPAAGYGSSLNRIWVNGFGSFHKQRDINGMMGYDYNSGGVILGYDREVAALPGLTLGINGAWSHGKLKNNDGLAKTDVDNFSLGFYGSYNFANGFFLDLNLAYGWGDNDSWVNRVVGYQTRGDFDSKSISAGLTAGYKINLTDKVRLTPSLGLQYTHINQDAWSERILNPVYGAVANWFGDVKEDMLEIPVNFTLDATINAGSAVVTPEFRVGAVFVADRPSNVLTMGFVGAPESINIYGINTSRTRFKGGAGVKIQFNDLVDLSANYDLEASSHYTAHSGFVGLGFSF